MHQTRRSTPKPAGVALHGAPPGPICEPEVLNLHRRKQEIIGHRGAATPAQPKRAATAATASRHAGGL